MGIRKVRQPAQDDTDRADMADMGSEFRSCGCESTLSAARLLFSSGCLPILCPGMEGDTGHVVDMEWKGSSRPSSQDGIFAALKLAEDLCSPSLQKILGCCLDNLRRPGPLRAVLNPEGKFRMKEGGGTRHSEIFGLSSGSAGNNSHK